MAYRSVINSLDLTDPNEYKQYNIALHELRSRMNPLTTGRWYAESGASMEDRLLLAGIYEEHGLLASEYPDHAERLFGYLALHGSHFVQDVVAWRALLMLEVGTPDRELRSQPAAEFLSRIVIGVLQDEQCVGRDTHYMFKNIANYVEGDYSYRAPTFEYAMFAVAYNSTHPDEPVLALRPPFEAVGN